MARTLIRFDTPVTDHEGGRFEAHACGRERDDGRWEAWLEFRDLRSGAVLRTQRETTQPNLTNATYWATGLTPVYLEGALDRIRHAPKRKAPQPLSPPHFDGPAQRTRARTADFSDPAPVLNPFSLYEKNPDLLAQELTALRGWHLRQIIRDFALVDERTVQLEGLSEPELGSLIMQRVRSLRP